MVQFFVNKYSNMTMYVAMCCMLYKVPQYVVNVAIIMMHMYLNFNTVLQLFLYLKCMNMKRVANM